MEKLLCSYSPLCYYFKLPRAANLVFWDTLYASLTFWNFYEFFSRISALSNSCNHLGNHPCPTHANISKIARITSCWLVALETLHNGIKYVQESGAETPKVLHKGYDETESGFNIDLIVFSLVGERIFPTGYCPIDRESEGLRFNVVIREDAKVSPFIDVIVKAALSTHLF